MVNGITGRERGSQPAARPCCRLSDFRPPQVSVLQPPLTGGALASFDVPARCRSPAPLREGGATPGATRSAEKGGRSPLSRDPGRRHCPPQPITSNDKRVAPPNCLSV